MPYQQGSLYLWLLPNQSGVHITYTCLLPAALWHLASCLATLHRAFCEPWCSGQRPDEAPLTPGALFPAGPRPLVRAEGAHRRVVRVGACQAPTHTSLGAGSPGRLDHAVGGRWQAARGCWAVWWAHDGDNGVATWGRADG